MTGLEKRAWLIMSLHRKKPKCARAAWRSKRVWMSAWWSPTMKELFAVDRWHRAVRGMR